MQIGIRGKIYKGLILFLFLFMSNLSFSHGVCNGLVPHKRKNNGLFRKGLTGRKRSGKSENDGYKYILPFLHNVFNSCLSRVY